MRRPDWLMRLSEAIDRHRDAPFEWGKSDCLTLPLDCAAAILGADPAEDYPGRHTYKTEQGAAKGLRKVGCQNVGDLFAQLLDEIPPAMAARGDIVVVVAPNGAVGGGVCVGSTIVCKSPAVGLSFIPLSAATRAFRVQ